jgi:heme exporter protein C
VDAPQDTGSRLTRALGLLTLAGLAILTFLAFAGTPRDELHGDTVRIIYIHPAAAVATYAAVGVLAVGSVLALWRKSVFWDLLGSAAAEIGIVFTVITLATGMLWGKPAWGTYWEWDPRLTSTALLLVLLIGYVAVRATTDDPAARARRAAVVGLVAAADVPVVKFSVDWWRSLHQPATTLRADPTIDGIMLFTMMLGIVVFLMLFAWLLVHRFRVAWLEAQASAGDLDAAIAERRAEAVLAR